MDIGKINRINTKPLGDAMVAPYWLVRSVQDKNMANMRKTPLTCTMTIVARDEEAPQRVTLLTMQNTKALKGGDELVLFAEPLVPSSIMPVQKLAQPARKRPAASVEHPAKKR